MLFLSLECCVIFKPLITRYTLKNCEKNILFSPWIVLGVSRIHRESGRNYISFGLSQVDSTARFVVFVNVIPVMCNYGKTDIGCCDCSFCSAKCEVKMQPCYAIEAPRGCGDHYFLWPVSTLEIDVVSMTPDCPFFPTHFWVTVVLVTKTSTTSFKNVNIILMAVLLTHTTCILPELLLPNKTFTASVSNFIPLIGKTSSHNLS